MIAEHTSSSMITGCYSGHVGDSWHLLKKGTSHNADQGDGDLPDHHSNLGKLVSAVYQHSSLDLVRQLMNRISPDELEGEDARGLNLLHHTILSKNIEVARMLFMKGHFAEVQQPSQIPYLHIACYIGNPTMVNLLLELRPQDYAISVPSDKWISACGALNLPIDSEKASEPEADLVAFADDPFVDDTHVVQHQVTALDVAAVGDHFKCIQTLLNSQASGCTLNSFVERAVEKKSSSALKLLLTNLSADQQDVDKAFREALRRKLHCCLAVLLEYGVRVEEVLNGMNPFHVMYMYSSAFQVHGRQHRNLGLAESTTSLVSHGIDVNTRMPLGSYPLYSLLHSLVQEKDHNPNNIPAFHIECLKILLEAGACPNFDEVEFAKIHTGHCSAEADDFDDAFTIALSFGREMHTSALNCFFSCLHQSDSWRGFMPSYFGTCVELLLSHGADPNYVDEFGDTPMHYLMKVLAMQHAYGHMHLDLSNIVKMLLLNGYDPNRESTNGIYPVNQYFIILLNLMGGLIAFKRWKADCSINQIFQLMYYMHAPNATKAGALMQQDFRKAQEEGCPTEVLQYISDKISAFTGAKTLGELSRFRVWELSGRKANNLTDLPLPQSVKQAILDMFSEVH